MDDDQNHQPFPLVLYRHDGELMMPSTHVTALLRRTAETFRLWRVRGEVRMDLETTARLYDSLVRYAADLEADITSADAYGQSRPAPEADRARADDLAQALAEVTADQGRLGGRVSAVEPGEPGLRRGHRPGRRGGSPLMYPLCLTDPRYPPGTYLAGGQFSCVSRLLGTQGHTTGADLRIGRSRGRRPTAAPARSGLARCTYIRTAVSAARAGAISSQIGKDHHYGE
ncbi:MULTISPECIES: hypothetical protein [unclassified Kitasatospora]|uniref:hypothetical protein n=1 Tax=unclassified Kitasatospora TaxID=2633591 RepID=UPI00070F148E|nr:MULTISPECIES: hypothetical protein [unclassified Kitasatospora]KQV11905.1 hypothetical protein ASC99_35600 [Kitasatospora sp. Root107]KRB68897.1 hypothetical protein ASE03_28785 [Kitasatospora sp. Root187]